MSLSRKLLALIVAVQLAALSAIAIQLHLDVTDQYRAFNQSKRDATRQQVNAAVEQQFLHMHTEARYWLAQTLPANSDLAELPNTAPPFAQHILQDSHTISLVRPNGDLMWSVAGPNIDRPATPYSIDSPAATELTGHRDIGRGFGTITAGPNGPQLAFSLALMDNAGTIGSYLILTRRLDQSFFQEQVFLQDRTFQLVTPTSENLSAGAAATLQLVPLSPAAQIELENQEQKAFVVFRDSAGTALATLDIDSPKFSAMFNTNPGLAMLRYIILTSLLSLLLISAFTQHLVGQPLRALKRKIVAGLESEPGDTLISHTGDDFRHIEEIFDRLIAERRKREARLRFFASAVDVADDAIAIIDRGGALHYVNPGYERLTGYASDELMQSESWWDHIFETKSMHYREGRSNEWEGTLRVNHADGAIREVEAKTYQLDDHEKNKAYFVLVMHDVTETNTQIAEIQRLATAVETIEDCIIIADTEGRIRYANPAYEKRCGRDLEDMMGMQTNALSHAASSAEVYADLQNTVVSGNAWRGELQAVFQDGRRVIDEAIVSPVANDQGDIVNYVTTLHDVTQRVTMTEDLRLAKERIEQTNDELEERVTNRTEELRIAKDAAEAANIAKSAFLATVSHEIRTPLNGILGMLELLGDYSLDNAQHRLLGSADTSAALLLSLINDILDFSKIEAGQLELDEFPVSLREATETVVLSMAPTAHINKIRLQSSLDPALPPTVSMDGVRLQQILLNLLGNAIKFTATTDASNGIVTMAVDEVPSPSSGERMLRFRVTDNGIGIPEESLATLFRPFTQAESSTTRRFGGTGLGLSISSKLVEMMRGHISVATEVGKGSEFTVLLPLQETAGDPTIKLPALPQMTAEASSPSWGATAARGRILIAEDNPINQEVIRLQLKAIGFDSDVADDGRAALTLWRGGSYDLVLTDCHMPKMDGFELARAIRSEEAAGERIPIVALTANVLSEESQKCRAADMDECLTKPIQRKHLDKALTVHLTAHALAALAGQAQHTAAASAATTLASLDFDDEDTTGLLNMQVFADNLGCDEHVQHELLRRFAEEATRNLMECSTAASDQDAATLKCNAHKLKSAARTLGAERLAAICVEIEAACENPDWDQLHLLLEQQSLLIAKLGHQIRQELERQGASASTLVQ